MMSVVAFSSIRLPAPGAAPATTATIATIATIAALSPLLFGPCFPSSSVFAAAFGTAWPWLCWSGRRRGRGVGGEGGDAGGACGRPPRRGGLLVTIGDDRRDDDDVRGPLRDRGPRLAATTTAGSWTDFSFAADGIGDGDGEGDDDETGISDHHASMGIARFDYDESQLPTGSTTDFRVVRQYTVPGLVDVHMVVSASEVDRLGLRPDNVTLPVALMCLDPVEYPTLSRARKACRKGSILIHRGTSCGPGASAIDRTHFGDDGDAARWKGKVSSRVYAGDVIAKQVRMGGGFYPSMAKNRKPPFDLPVLYEDDHFAIVNKPAGVVTNSQRKHGHGMNSVRSALPFVLRPPGKGTISILRRPQPVHRLDKPTSGLLLVAKTKCAHVCLTRQFVERKVKKTYTAIVNGVPREDSTRVISPADAARLGVDVKVDDGCGDRDGNADTHGGGEIAHPSTLSRWQLIDEPLEEKSAVTVWRSLRSCKSLNARDGALTLVELKPKTGRYHQLRRHMAWFKDCPLVGDSEYAGSSEAADFGGKGLLLCSNEVTLEHPHYNTEVGKKEWRKNLRGGQHVSMSATRHVEVKEDQTTGKILVRASIPLPDKFALVLAHEDEKATKLDQDTWANLETSSM